MNFVKSSKSEFFAYKNNKVNNCDKDIETFTIICVSNTINGDCLINF